MNIFIFLFQEILYRPLLNFLVFLYLLPPHDLGVAILILTLIVKLALFPLTKKTILEQRKSQESSVKLQTEMQKLKEKYNGDPQKQSEELAKLFKTQRLNLFSVFIPTLIQLVILIALFQVFRNIGNAGQDLMLYSFVQDPGVIDHVTFGFLDLTKPNSILAVFVGLVQYIQTMMIQPKLNRKQRKQNSTLAMQGSMNIMMSFFMMIVALRFPSSLALFWCLSGIFTIIQQKLILKQQPTTSDKKQEK